MPHLPRLAADRARDRVDHQFHRKADAGAGDAAIRQEPGLVGRYAMGLAAVAAEIVGPRQIAGRLPRLERDRERPVGIGAAVDGDFGVERQQPAAFVRVRGEPVVMLARVGADHQVLAPILDVTEGPAILERQPRNAQLFGMHDDLVAEAAADIGRDHPHPAPGRCRGTAQGRRGRHAAPASNSRRRAGRCARPNGPGSPCPPSAPWPGG